MNSNAVDLTEKTILVTGATDGLGRALAHALAAGGATVLIHGRDAERIRRTETEIRRAGGRGELRSYRADLSSLADVRRMAEEIRARETRLDVLVNNAGIGRTGPGGDRRMLSADGYELRFAVNYLAGYRLTRLLLDLLIASAPARIVNVASAGQAALDFDDVMLERGYTGGRAYGQSKLAQILFTFTLADELAGTGVTATCLHPATYMPTKIVAAPASTLAEGVAATLRLAVDPALDGVTGEYFNGTRAARADPQAYDPAARRRLAELSAELVRPGASPPPAGRGDDPPG
jgi:NAD(P)-dependent dehydrogenase (short-subunit alcohol dehydrogenase family)